MNAPDMLQASFRPLTSTYLKLEAEEPSAAKRAEALEALCEVLQDCSLAASQELGHALRIEGGVLRLGQLLQDSSDDVSAYALWILGNLCCNQVDPHSDETKAELLAGGCEVSVLQCLASENIDTLSSACGLCLNLSSNARWCRVLSQHAARFEDLLNHSDQNISHFATATLRNLIVLGESEESGASVSAADRPYSDADHRQMRNTASPQGISPQALSAVATFEEQRKVTAMSKVHAKRVISNAIRQRRIREFNAILAAMNRMDELGGFRKVHFTGKYSPELLRFLWREASVSCLAEEQAK